MNLARFGPARQTGHDVELFQQSCDDVLCVGFFGESIEVGDDLEEGVLGVFNGLVAEVFALGLQALMMFEKLFAIKSVSANRGGAGGSKKAWDSGSCSAYRITAV